MTPHPSPALLTPSGALPLPIFLPDATRAVVRGVDSADLEACGVEGLVMSAYHLMQRPGSTTVSALGGLGTMTGWRRPIITDSGGFQIYSLIRENPNAGTLRDKGATFAIEGKKINLTPEKSIQLQLSYRSDVVICLDDCTHPDAPDADQRESVRRTIRWARRCKGEFERILSGRKGDAPRPLLFAVVQGGASRDLRRECAEALLAIGFDGYGYGGFPLDGEGNLLTEILGYTRDLIPRGYPMHALGVGHPKNVWTCHALGYPIFDSAMPTRDARHGRLYVIDGDPRRGGDWLRYIYADDKKHLKDGQPIDSACDCPVCQRYPLGYIHHLFKIGDSTFQRFATMHNLRTMTRLIAILREGV
ncbi:MAG TPA: tRNA guanosine(34) transglycosylase Tgt [Aggregatilineales bacterium]|nr:queuine tRNA-ribosyltransferase family protein [Anaerolineales bacterium]HRE46299.1 tRNA guanosine(34) transglycosylase Tgt [Aggregatilineales bacterium]